MTESATPSPSEDDQLAAVIGRLDAGARELIGRMWTRPASKPLALMPGIAAAFAALEAEGLAIDEVDAGGGRVVVLTRLGQDVARELRRLGDAAPPPPPPAPSLKALKGGLDTPRMERAPAPAEAAPPRDEGRGGGGGGRRRRPEREPGEIYPGCPVQALGVHGKMFFYLDLLGQLHAVDNHTKDRMRALFGGRSDLLMGAWPTWSKGEEPKVIGWKQEDAAAAMQRACAEKGVWNAFERVRGLGAWPDQDGGVALHCGDAILYGGAWRAPGEIDGYVYPSASRIPKPLDEAPSAAHASELLGLLETWKWLRGDLDAYLLLGWICGAMFGGAIDWRPLAWITGDKGTGKSTVQKLIRHVMGGEGAILQSTDATEASIRQFLMQSTVPVALDELEAEADNRRAHAVIKLARQAASGGVVLRGGADHVGQEFRARSAFLFSSILIPPLLDQDISRIALLELLPLERGETSPSIEARRWGQVGRGLRAQLLSQWDRLQPTLELYRQALHRAGHDARGCDQFGTLLAMADLAMQASLPDAERCESWASRLSATAIGDQTDQLSDWQRMVAHLMGQHLDMWRGGDRYTLGTWILAAAGLLENPDPIKAQNALPAYGLRVTGRGETARLVMANNHPGLAKLFEGTHWGAGGGQKGVWAQAAKRIPGSTSTGVLRFAGVPTRAYEFSLSSVPDFFETRAPRSEPAEQVFSQDQRPAPAPANPDDFA